MAFTFKKLKSSEQEQKNSASTSSNNLNTPNINKVKPSYENEVVPLIEEKKKCENIIKCMELGNKIEEKSAIYLQKSLKENNIEEFQKIIQNLYFNMTSHTYFNTWKKEIKSKPDFQSSFEKYFLVFELEKIDNKENQNNKNNKNNLI